MEITNPSFYKSGGLSREPGESVKERIGEKRGVCRGCESPGSENVSVLSLCSEGNLQCSFYTLASASPIFPKIIPH